MREMDDVPSQDANGTGQRGEETAGDGKGGGPVQGFSRAEWEEIRRFLRRMVGAVPGDLRARFDESDVVQQAILRIYEKGDQRTGTTQAEAFSWFKRILLTVYLNMVRDHHARGRDARREAVSKDSAEGKIPINIARVSSTSHQAMRNELRARALDTIMAMPSPQREAVAGRVFLGWKLSDIEAILGLDHRQAVKDLTRGMEVLRRRLKKDA